MRMAPAREASSHVLPDPTELLIKEARRKTRRRRLKVGEILLAVVLLAVVVAYGIGHIGNGARPTTATSLSSRVAASAPRCSLSQLRLISDRGGWHANYAASGQFTETLTFTNVSRSACQLSGWPRVQAVVNGALQPTPMTLVRQNAPPSKSSSLVRLAPGKTASFNIYGGPEQSMSSNDNRPPGFATGGFGESRGSHRGTRLWRLLCLAADRRE